MYFDKLSMTKNKLIKQYRTFFKVEQFSDKIIVARIITFMVLLLIVLLLLVLVVLKIKTQLITH